MFWNNIKNLFVNFSNPITAGEKAFKYGIYTVLLAALCVGFGIPLANLAGENAQQSEQIAQLVQFQKDFENWKANELIPWQTKTTANISAAQSRADSAWTLASDTSNALADFYNNEYIPFFNGQNLNEATQNETINKIDTRLHGTEDLLNNPGPTLTANVASGMKLLAGQTIMEGSIKFTMLNLFPVVFKNLYFRLILKGDGVFAGPVGVRIMYSTGVNPHFVVVGDDGQNIYFQSSHLTDIPAKTTTSFTADIHIEFPASVDKDINFTPFFEIIGL
jgi:hypothetical protein